MGITEYSILVVVGVAAGFINVVAGGGSMLTVPALVLMGVPGAVANGTNRIAIIAQTLAASATFFRRGVRDLRLSATLAVALLPGAILGAWTGAHIGGEWFNRLLAGVMVAVMLTMGLENRVKRAAAAAVTGTTLRRPLLTHALIAVIGFYGGIIHIGIGFLIMFVLHRVGGLDLVRVNMHKMVIVIPYSVVALGIFWAESGILWWAGLALAVGNAAGGWLGAHLSITRGERFIRIAFNLCIVALILRLVFGQ
ncbi:MAG: sulfite exporter TauE/SafE family protein [Gammaproteobacteria bacterium]|nr:sulfite exporter TauE/SafE family protein [Gammaproteobacteria bacterium]MCP5198585.1 sulfite exporter TauE/SafE family protein [Gammaproteobacteria bacterium]